MQRLLFALLVLSPVARIAAQEFEVASIKLIEPGVPSTFGIKVHPGARVILSGLSLKAMVATAFGLSYWQISGGEPWIEKDSYIVEAVPPEKLRESITNLRHTLSA